MIGQGHQIFVDELERLAAETADPRYTAIADRLAAPPRVAVSGRRGVGRNTVAQALDQAGRARGALTVTTSSHADVDVYVLTEVVKPEDRAAIAAARRPVVVVLNKADLIATARPGAARKHCARLSARTGLSIEPLVGLLALSDVVDDAAWAALHELTAGQPVPARLLDALDVFGVEQALAAIRRGATRGQTCAVLRRLSGIDDVVDKVRSVGAQVRYQRVLDAVADLQTMAVTDHRVAEFLSRDDTVMARMTAAADVVEAAGMHVQRCDDPGAYLRRAASWQRYRHGPVAGLHRSCGADIVRGSLRLWSKAGS